MIEFFEHWLEYWGFSEQIYLKLSIILTLISIALIYMVVDFLVQKVILRMLKKYIHLTSNKWDDILLENKVFSKMARIAPILVVYGFSSIFPTYEEMIKRIIFAYIILIIILVLNSTIDAIEDIYWEFEVSKTKPIKGYLQVIQMVAWVVGIVIIVSVLVDRSPVILLSGIGAATAVLLLIFQNSILGLVASIQLSANDMLKIGDWISMPSHDVDGDVLDISLHTVKIQNWDKTIVTVPTYKMTSESFTNWEGMVKSGGRRIKRAIYIDLSSVGFCSEEMLEKFKKIDYLKHYLAVKENDIASYNKENNIEKESLINGRHLTNIGTFRAYLDAYLQNHPGLNKDMLCMARQLQPTEKGLPIEIYTFTNDTAWLGYEAIQSDIFDHIIAVIPEFGLRIYQSPSGHDLRKLKEI